MAVANVTLTDTFDQWRIKTNQLISVYDQTNELALRAYNVSNSVANSAANIAVELVYGNTTIMNTIYRNANTITYDWIGNNDITTIKNRSNIAVNTANYVYQLANDISNTSNYVYAVSNGVYNVSNVVYAFANTVYDASNISYSAANSAYSFGNLVYSFGNTVFGVSNNVSNTFNVLYVSVNNNSNTVNAVYVSSNNNTNTVNLIYEVSNNTSNLANVAYLYANNAYNIANNVQLNVTNVVANTLAANAQISEMINATANIAIFNYLSTTDFSSAYIRANLSYQSANQSYNIANIAFNQSNTAYNVAINAASYMYANGVANSSNIYGMVYANGVANSANLYGMVYANGVANAANSNAATKVASVTGTAGQIFSSGGTTPTLNLITTAVTSSTYGGATQIPVFTVDTFGRLTYAANVVVQGMDYPFANGVANSANLYGMAYANGVANSANIYGMTYANSTFGTIANTASAFRHANSAFDKANGAAQLSFVNVAANGTNLVAESNTDTLVLTPTAPISIVGDAGTDTVTIGLQTSGVSATTYGGTTQIPVYTVDSFGRITYSANVSLSTGAATIGSESSSESTFYPLFTSTTSGTLATANVDTINLSYVPSTGTLSALAFNSLSDMSLKDNITPIDNSLDVLKSLTGVSFDWKDSGSKSYGVVAQDVERIIPELVGKINRGKTVNYDGIIAFLIEAIKEMSEKIDKLEKKQ